MSDRIELTYHGADAERNVLDLYDAGRALYGVARFIYTLENFRVSGVIVEHATSARAKFELLPSRPGSFTFGIEHIVAAIGRENAAKIAKVPLAAMVAWITKRITGDKKSDVDPMLRQSVELEREKTAQITVEAMRDVAVAAIRANQASERRQSDLIRRYEGELSAIPEQRVRALESKLRPSLIDMARPTSSSASYLSMSVNRGEPVLYMDEQTAEALKGNQIDKLSQITGVRFIQYNVETGWGKVRLPWRMALYRFMVHPLLRPSANSQILAAMDEKDAVWVWFYNVRDKSGNISHLLFDKFAADSEIPPPNLGGDDLLIGSAQRGSRHPRCFDIPASIGDPRRDGVCCYRAAIDVSVQDLIFRARLPEGRRGSIVVERADCHAIELRSPDSSELSRAKRKPTATDATFWSDAEVGYANWNPS